MSAPKTLAQELQGVHELVARVDAVLEGNGVADGEGHVEAGETIKDAAVRETMEEMGLTDLKVIKPLGKIDFWFRDRYRKESRGMLIHKDVHYFLMEAPSDAEGTPQKKEKIRKLIWTSLAQVERKSGYTDVKPIVAKALQHFGVSMRKIGGRGGAASKQSQSKRRRTRGGGRKHKNGTAKPKKSVPPSRDRKST